MWEYWRPASAAIGRDVLIIAFRRERLSRDDITECFTRLGDISEEPVVVKGRRVSHFYWRVGYDYRPAPARLTAGADTGRDEPAE